MFWYPSAQADHVNRTVPISRGHKNASHRPAGSRNAVFRLFWPVLRPLFWVLTFSALAAAADKPFDMSSNWGGTGLMEIPTARIIPDGEMRLGPAKASPYIWYAFGFGVLPGLEFTGRYTDVTNIDAGLGPEFGSYKDKAFDIKHQLLPESKHTPAIALGWNDFQGTRLFEAQYLVISRQLYPLDITLGVGRRRLKGPLSIGDEIGFWGGMEWAVTHRLHLMLEYNPIEYQDDLLPSRGVPQGSDSPFNLGMRYRTWFGLDLGLSYQRGDTIGMSAHMQFELGRPILPPKPDPPSWRFAQPAADPPAKAEQRIRRLSAAVGKAGFIDIGVKEEAGNLVVEFENNRYLSDAQAAGRAMRLLMQHANSTTDQLTVVMKRKGMKILYVSAKAEDARRFFIGDMTLDHFSRRLIVIPQTTNAVKPALTAEDIGAAAHHQTARHKLSYGIDPVLESFFDQATAEYQSRLSIMPYATLNLWPGGNLHGSYDIPLYSDVESIVVTPPGAVRSDAWEYLGDQPTVHRLLFDQVVNPIPFTYARFSVGYLERMYTGVGAEVLTFMGQGRWAVGLEGDWVRKRDPDAPLSLTDQYNHTFLGNLYYRYLPLDVTLKAQAGRFLAGDTGARLEFRRRFDTGAQIGFWYSITDTDHLTGFNRGYNDKGICLKLPFATFTDRPTRRLLQYSISPWTRDVGVTIDHWQEIYDTVSDLSPLYFRRGLDRFDE